MAKRRGRNSRGVGNKEKDDKEKDEEKEKDKEPGASQGSQKKDEKEQERQKRRRRERKERDVAGKEKAGIDLEKVARQLDFYFSDANLRRDRYMKKTFDEGDGAVSLEILLNFNRIKALGVTKTSQLLEAVQCSGMLDVEEGTKVRRDFQKHPLGTYDPVSRTLYVEGLPLTLGVDDLKKFFSDYGQVKLVEVPQHRETREPRGFAFVEFGDVQEADAALRGCNGLWPSVWPSRFDGKKLRLMWKAEWHQQCREYKLLQATSRGPTFEGRPKGDPPATPSRIVPAVPDVRDGAGEAAVPESGATGSTESASAAGSSEVVEKPRPSRTPGCLVKLTGFSGDDELLCTLAIRQFAEHAVTVEYCDYVPSASTALLRLKCPEDTATLLEDMKLTGRMLGCQQPTAEVLGREEEEKYWQDVMQRAQKRGPKSDAALKDTKQTAKRREPENVVTRIRRWRPVSNPNRSKFRAGFTDTAGGSANFVASGFGKRKEKRAPKVIPPRKREEEAGPSASSKAKKVEKEKVPLVPPPSPFQLPGTTRKRRRGTQVPPPSPALPPPSPCGRSESMSPESDAASAEPPAVPPPEPPEGDLEFDPDDIVSMMEDFH